MYQPETEDLIPRCAPKPSTAVANEAIIRPSVPEVSIVFSQSESLPSSSIAPPTTASYATWKKQCLPNVVYPPTAEITNAEMSAMSGRSKVFPMRNPLAQISDASGSDFFLTRSSPSTIRRNSNVSVQPSCNVESPMVQCNPTYTVSAQCSKMNNNTRQNCFDHIRMQQQNMNANILTICASTQTDFCSLATTNELDRKDLATKEDIASIKTMIVAMHTEQRRLIEIIQNLLVSQGKTQYEETPHKTRDAATQCDSQHSIGPLPQKRAHVKYDSIEEEDSVEEDDSYRFQKKINVLIESPPIVQQFQPQVLRAINCPHSDVISSLPKPSTEQSMVMNELALKYLPNEKLSELLKEMRVTPVVQQRAEAQNVYESPLKNIENYGKSPSDLSTASYKYLKKYRLLPEENNNLSPSSNERKLSSPNHQENMLDLEKIRRQPKFM